MPVEAPAAPVESTAAPVSAPESTAAASAATTVSNAATEAPQTETQPQAEQSPFAGQSIEDTIFKTLEEKRQAREKAAEVPAQTEEERLVAEAKAKEGTQVETPAAQTEEEKAAAAQQAAEKVAAEPTFDLNEPEITSKWLDDLAKAEKVKFADDSTRGLFFKTVREHGEFKKVAELFPDVESAQEAQVHAANYIAADEAFRNAHTPDGTINFLRYLMAEEDKNPILPQGQSVVRAMFDNMRAWDFEQYEKQFREKGDEEGLAALDLLRGRISPNRSPATEELPPHLAQRAAALTAKEQELSRKESEQQTQVRQQYTRDIATDLEKQIAAAVAPALKAGAFSDAIQEACEKKIYDRVLEVLERNELYKAQSRQLEARPMSPENRQALVALKMKYFNTVAPDIMRRTIREFSTPVVQAQAERDAKQKEQEARSKSEPKGVTAPVTVQAPTSPADFVSKAIADLAKENGGRRPSQDQIINRVVEMKQQAKQQAAR